MSFAILAARRRALHASQGNRMHSSLPRLFLLLSFVVAAACSSSGAAGMTAPPAGVQVTPLSLSKVHNFTEYLAELKSRQSILLQPQVEGQITKILVKSGAVVNVGDVIMQIDPARQQATVMSAEASHASQLANLSYAKQAYERAQRLYEGGAVSKQELDQARASYDSLQSQIAALGAQVRENQVQLGYYRIVAPAHGVVGDIPVRVGDHVTPSTKLTTLDQNALLEAYISVPVERASELRNEVVIELVDSVGGTLSRGPISFISPQVSEDTQSVLVKTIVDNAKNQLRDSQFVRARVVWSTHDGLTIPALAVIRVNGQTFAYVATDDKGHLVARQKPVDLGELVDGAYVVRGGLAPGERLITGGVQHIADGAPIVAEADPPAKAVAAQH
jgi:RND family efflux transporter MFP subunit